MLNPLRSVKATSGVWGEQPAKKVINESDPQTWALKLNYRWACINISHFQWDSRCFSCHHLLTCYIWCKYSNSPTFTSYEKLLLAPLSNVKFEFWWGKVTTMRLGLNNRVPFCMSVIQTNSPFVPVVVVVVAVDTAMWAERWSCPDPLAPLWALAPPSSAPPT